LVVLQIAVSDYIVTPRGIVVFYKVHFSLAGDASGGEQATIYLASTLGALE
jgi:hypothetical protein